MNLRTNTHGTTVEIWDGDTMLAVVEVTRDVPARFHEGKQESARVVEMVARGFMVDEVDSEDQRYGDTVLMSSVASSGALAKRVVR